MENKKCINCKTDLQGQFCHICGEKQVTPKDFTLVKIAEQTVDIFTHLDSKLIKSAKFLLFKPGHLSTAYIEGLRKPFMKPFQIFILANILFFLLLSDVDVFRKPSSWWFNVTDDMGYNIKVMAEKKAAEISKSVSDVALLYDQKSKTVAKTLVIVFIPLLGLTFAALFIRKKMQIGKHVIFATHFFAFTLIIMIVWFQLVNLLFSNPTSKHYVIPIQLILLVYLIFAIRQFYKTGWIYVIVATLLSISLFDLLIEVYRFLVSFYSLTSIH